MLNGVQCTAGGFFKTKGSRAFKVDECEKNIVILSELYCTAYAFLLSLSSLDILMSLSFCVNFLCVFLLVYLETASH